MRNQVAYDAGANKAAIYDAYGNALIVQVSTVENDYALLNNKPKINGVVLQGDVSLESLGIETITNSEIDEVVAS